MALIKCPECGKEISDKAVSCPECGLPKEEFEELMFKNGDLPLERCNSFFEEKISYLKNYVVFTHPSRNDLKIILKLQFTVNATNGTYSLIFSTSLLTYFDREPGLCGLAKLPITYVVGKRMLHATTYKFIAACRNCKANLNLIRNIIDVSDKKITDFEFDEFEAFESYIERFGDVDLKLKCINGEYFIEGRREKDGIETKLEYVQDKYPDFDFSNIMNNDFLPFIKGVYNMIEKNDLKPETM